MAPAPQEIQLIGNELCILWQEGKESYFPMDFVRLHSPSASNIGEKDIFGTQYGGDGPKNFEGVTIVSWELVGNYGIRFTFSDHHNTGIFSWDYLKEIEALQSTS